MNAVETQLFLTLLVIISIVVVAGVKVGAWWLRLALIDVLAVMLLKRLDAIGELLDHDVITTTMSDLATVLALLAIIFAFVAAYQRRAYLSRAEQQRHRDLWQKHQDKIDYLEALRARSEQGMSWDLEQHLIT